MADVDNLIDRYVAVWNEPDPEARRAQLSALWAVRGRQVLTPPKEMLGAARALGFPSPTLEVTGHDELEFRVARAHEEFVAPGAYVFRARSRGARLRDVVLFDWSMVATADGEPVGGGTEILLLDDDGRITVDYQFVDP